MRIRSYQDAIRALERIQRPDSDTDARARKRSRIVAAASALFLRHGYRKTSMEAVADQAGVAKGTLYLYFKTKAELLAQAIVDEKLRYAEGIRPIFDASLPARERLRRYVRISFELSAQMPLSASLLAGNHEILTALEEMDPAVLRQSQEMGLGFLADLIAAACGGRAPTAAMRERAAAFIDLLTAALIYGSRDRRQLPGPRFGEVVADILIDGAATPAAGSEKRPANKARPRR